MSSQLVQEKQYSTGLHKFMNRISKESPNGIGRCNIFGSHNCGKPVSSNTWCKGSIKGEESNRSNGKAQGIDDGFHGWPFEYKVGSGHPKRTLIRIEEVYVDVEIHVPAVELLEEVKDELLSSKSHKGNLVAMDFL